VNVALTLENSQSDGIAANQSRNLDRGVWVRTGRATLVARSLDEVRGDERNATTHVAASL
jgi:hypothetical protein